MKEALEHPQPKSEACGYSDSRIAIPQSRSHKVAATIREPATLHYLHWVHLFWNRRSGSAAGSAARACPIFSAMRRHIVN
jgi:hypothetical protein